MSKVYGIGETVVDIIFKDNKVISAKPGGSVLNSMISLGRLGVDCSFISDYGMDDAGKLIDSFLADNQVDTKYVTRMKSHKSSIALAFLDENNDAQYNFYKDLPNERLSGLNIDFEEDDIFLFGSFFAISETSRSVVMRLLLEASSARSIVIYDPNFRKPHLNELEKLKPWIIENMSFADIVRGSDEDFYMIFGSNSVEDAYKIVSEAGCPNLIYTANKQEVVIIGQGTKISLEVPEIETQSTIGAGDNFNSGIIWTLIREELSRRDLEHLPESIWRLIGQTGIDFSAEVCKNLENYISVEFVVEMLNR